MNITQEQFDGIVFYTLQSFRYAVQGNNKDSYASYEIARDWFVAVDSGINILRGDSELAFNVLCRNQINCNPSKLSDTIGNSLLRINRLLSNNDPEQFKKLITNSLNKHFKTHLAYSLEDSITPSFLMLFWDVYGKEMLIGLSLCLFGALLLTLAPPSIVILGGVPLAAGIVLTLHSLLESSSLFFSPVRKETTNPDPIISPALN